jgi:SurA N-terminal domain
MLDLKRRAALVILAALMIALIVSVGSSGAETSASTCPATAAPSSASTTPVTTSPAASVAPAPDEALVCVGAQAITGATYSHWLAIAKKFETPTAKGRHAATATEDQSEVLQFLISADWVRGEAASKGISVSAAEVKKTFDRIRRQEFPKRREYEKFLRHSGQTVTDLMFRVEQNLLSERIQKSVTAGHHSQTSKLRALSQFVKAFKLKWQAQTYCASEYAVADCGHVQATV